MEAAVRLRHNVAMTKTSQQHVLESLVAEGRLAAADADRIRHAPRVVVQTRELLSYLGGLIVVVGVVRLIAAVLEDASKLAIAGVLYVAAVILGAVAWRFVRRPGAWGRFGEVLETASLAALVVAVALTTFDAGLSSEASALIAGSIVTGWSAVRLRSSQFAGTLMATVGVMTMSFALSSLLDLVEEEGAIPIFFAGLVLIAVGMLTIPLRFVPRGVGSVTVLFTTITWMAMHEGLDGLLPGVLVGAAVFALGASRMWIEVFIPAGILIVVSVAMFVFRNVDNDVLQGLIVVVVGLATLGGTALVFRRMRARTASV